MTRRRTMPRTIFACALAALLSVSAGSAGAAEITLISAGAVRAVVSGLAESFAHDTGHSVKATFGTVGVVRKTLGEQPADVVIATDVAIDDLIKQGAVLGPRVDVARA